MITQTVKRSLVSERQAVLAAAWAGMLLASMLPGIVWQEVFGGSLPQALWLRLGGGLAFLGLSLAWKALRPLSGYFVLLAAILAADELLRPLVAASAVWQGWFGPDRASLFWSSLGPQLLRLLMSLAVWLVLVLLGLKRSDYFLVKGRLNAPAEPVRWLGIRAGQPWSQAAVQFAIAMSLVFLGISVLSYRPGLGALAGALPWLPAVLLFAALNAFNENFIARAAPLSQLVSAVGQPQALLLSTVFFALGHFYGTPPGLLGLLLPGLLGWLLGRCMLETKGFLLAWLIQLPLDCLVFFFWFLSQPL